MTGGVFKFSSSSVQNTVLILALVPERNLGGAIPVGQRSRPIFETSPARDVAILETSPARNVEIFSVALHSIARYVTVEFQPYSGQKRIVLSMERAITQT
jgi:hypothetical protein